MMKIWVDAKWIRGEADDDLRARAYYLALAGNPRAVVADPSFGGLAAHHAREDRPLTDALPANLRANGTFVLCDGNHRAQWRLARGADNLLLEVVSISPLWQELVSKLQAIYGDESLYQPIDHPFFEGWRARRNPLRFSAVVNLVDRGVVHGKLVQRRHDNVGLALDFGSCTGWFSRMLAEKGFFVRAYDHDPNALWIAEFLAGVFPSPMPIVSMRADLLDVVQRQPKVAPPYDWHWMHWPTEVAVALSLLHHWLIPGLEPSCEFLRILARQSNLVVVDLPGEKEEWIETSVPLREVEPAWREVLETGGMAVEVVGEYDGRKMLAAWAKERRTKIHVI